MTSKASFIPKMTFEEVEVKTKIADLPQEIREKLLKNGVTELLPVQ